MKIHRLLLKKTALALAALALAEPVAQADYANSPNPYDPYFATGTFTPTGQSGFPGSDPSAVSTGTGDDPDGGLNLPSVGYSSTVTDPRPYLPADGFTVEDGPDITWGGWNRGDAGTIWAEWDTFYEDAPGSRMASADDGQGGSGMSGTSSATISWNEGTFKAASGNLFNFTGPEGSTYQINIDVSGLSGINQVAMQVEQFAPLEAEWNAAQDGYDISGPWTLSLDGGAAMDRDVFAFTYADRYPYDFFPDYELFMGILLWNVDLTGVDTLTIDFDNPVHTSFAQVAIDIGGGSFGPCFIGSLLRP
jgi:hypothetical protein